VPIKIGTHAAYKWTTSKWGKSYSPKSRPPAFVKDVESKPKGTTSWCRILLRYVLQWRMGGPATFQSHRAGENIRDVYFVKRDAGQSGNQQRVQECIVRGYIHTPVGLRHDLEYHLWLSHKSKSQNKDLTSTTRSTWRMYLDIWSEPPRQENLTALSLAAKHKVHIHHWEQETTLTDNGCAKNLRQIYESSNNPTRGTSNAVQKISMTVNHLGFDWQGYTSKDDNSR
jgi:hypothetical protein